MASCTCALFTYLLNFLFRWMCFRVFYTPPQNLVGEAPRNCGSSVWSRHGMWSKPLQHTPLLRAPHRLRHRYRTGGGVPPFSPLSATRWISPACRYTSVTIVP
jgi:hypothetical protein